jgi:hypothetical protein
VCFEIQSLFFNFCRLLFLPVKPRGVEWFFRNQSSIILMEQSKRWKFDQKHFWGAWEFADSIFIERTQ